MDILPELIFCNHLQIVLLPSASADGWRLGRMGEWGTSGRLRHVGGMEKWRNGGMEEWRNASAAVAISALSVPLLEVLNKNFHFLYSSTICLYIVTLAETNFK